MRGYNEMKLSDGVFTIWNTSMLLGVYTWHLGTLWPVLAVMAGWVAPLVYIGDGVKRIQMRGYNKMELSDGVFMVWTTLMLLGVYTWHLGTLWPVLAVMAGWVAPLVHIGDGVKRIQIYQKTLSSISDVTWMSRVDFGLKLVFCVLESVCHALCMLSSTFVCLD